MEGLKALENLKDIAIYEENNNQCSDLGDCCDFKGELGEVYKEEIDAIEKDLNRLKKQDKVIAIIKEHIISPKYDRSGIYVEKNGDLYEIKLKNGTSCFFTEEEIKALEGVFFNNGQM